MFVYTICSGAAAAAEGGKQQKCGSGGGGGNYECAGDGGGRTIEIQLEILTIEILNWQTMEKRREFLSLVQCYIIVFEIDSLPFSDFFELTKRVSMGWWLLRLSAKIFALLRLSVNFFQLRLTKKLKINFFRFKKLNIN